MAGELISRVDPIEAILKAIEDENSTAEPSVDVILLKLNALIQRTLQGYFHHTNQIEFRFDLPEKTPETATVSIFLYDVQEDLQMRQGESRRYDPATGTQAPGLVHVRCCYLLTYWPGSEHINYEEPDNEPAWAMNRVLNALLNRRTFTELPGSYTRVIPPSEHLNSLGTFWQALGNKPRLCLSYAVTVPMQLLGEKKVETPPIRSTNTKLDIQDAGDALEQASADLWQRMCSTLCEQDQNNRKTILRELGRVVLRCVPIKLNQGAPYLRLMISGVTTEARKAALLRELGDLQAKSGAQKISEGWSQITYNVGGTAMAVKEAEVDQLTTIAVLPPS